MTKNMNITLSADEHLIEKARLKAQQNNTSLNQVFQQWLFQYVQDQHSSLKYETLMKNLNQVEAGKKWTRDELNER